MLHPTDNKKITITTQSFPDKAEQSKEVTVTLMSFTQLCDLPVDIEEAVERPGLTNVGFDGQLRVWGDHQRFQGRVTGAHQFQEQVLHTEHKQYSMSKHTFLSLSLSQSQGQAVSPPPASPLVSPVSTDADNLILFPSAKRRSTCVPGKSCLACKTWLKKWTIFCFSFFFSSTFQKKKKKKWQPKSANHTCWNWKNSRKSRVGSYANRKDTKGLQFCKYLRLHPTHVTDCERCDRTSLLVARRATASSSLVKTWHLVRNLSSSFCLIWPSQSPHFSNWTTIWNWETQPLIQNSFKTTEENAYFNYFFKIWG